MQPPCYPAVAVLGMYTREMKNDVHIKCVHMFTVVLSIIAPNWK